MMAKLTGAKTDWLWAIAISADRGEGEDHV
jgi:hypothetical protein